MIEPLIFKLFVIVQLLVVLILFLDLEVVWFRVGQYK